MRSARVKDNVLIVTGGSLGIVYLASDESKFCTGGELVIEGGYTAR